MKKTFQGLLIGIANAIPGVSGATMAILFDAYDELLNLFEKPYSFKVLKKNFYLLIGMALGTVGAVLGLTVLFSRFPLLMTCFFLGLVLSGVLGVIKKVKNLSINGVIMFFIGVLIILGIEILANISRNTKPPLYWFAFGGLFTSIAIILPGVSASLTLMALNLFFPIIALLKASLESFFVFSFPSWEKIVPVGLFGLTLSIGIVVCAKTMKKMGSRHQEKLTFLSLGLIIASIGAVIAELPISNHVLALPWEIILGTGLGIFTFFMLNLFIKQPPKHLG
ncbi:MAG: DUF368 domain-containing protein [Bacilli bacterium]|nr:DUF368 domain-containing protein [Bacilli bacterium]